MAQALQSLDGPRPLSTRTRVGAAVLLVVYFGTVAAVFLRPDAPVRSLPSFALAHALVAGFVSAVTALLMVNHARSTGRRGYLMIGGTFLYMCLVLLFFPMYFAGAVMAEERVWGGPQSAANLFYAWHFAFPIGVALSAYLLYADQRSHRRPGVSRAQLTAGLLMTLAGTAATLLLVTFGSDLLPDVLTAAGFTTTYSRFLDALLVVLSLICLAVTVYCARNGSLIGIWLVALMLLVLGEAVVNLGTSGQYTTGWYMGRLMWLIAVAALLMALIWNLSRVERANSELAAFDWLTGAESRISLLDTMHREIARVRQTDGEVAMLWIDLDGFKGINDQLGHQIGDRVLREIADRLSHQVRVGDHVGRLGGDEFGVLLCDDVQPTRVDAIADRLLASVREPIRCDDLLVHVTAAIGIALAPKDATRAEDLLLCADLAMYAAKGRGGDRYERFNASIGTEAVAKARLRHELTSALRKGEFCLYYQPIYEADGQRMAGVEVLARWLREGVALPAGEFVPFAEESGQIISLGRIVLRQLARELPRWLDHHGPDFFVCVNLSVRELADGPLIEELLDSELTRRPGQLVIEITESLELQENSEAAANLTRLREAGMRIAIDDFGAGFSNFTRLERLHPSLLKIDRSLVQRAGSETEGGVAFLTAATSVAASLNCEVVAEGVETPAEAQVVTLLGVRYVQGYRYCEPGPIEAFLESSVSSL